MNGTIIRNNQNNGIINNNKNNAIGGDSTTKERIIEKKKNHVHSRTTRNNADEDSDHTQSLRPPLRPTSNNDDYYTSLRQHHHVMMPPGHHPSIGDSTASSSLVPPFRGSIIVNNNATNDPPGIMSFATMHHVQQCQSSGNNAIMTDEENTTMNDEGLLPSSNMATSTNKPIGEENVVKDKLISSFVLGNTILAWCCAIFVPVWKIVDTSYLFRERDDPSMFDKITDYFGYDSRWPFAKLINNGKDVYRIYFFIVPFFLSFMFFALKEVVVQNRRKIHRTPQTPRFLWWLRYRVMFGLSTVDFLLITVTLTYSALLLWARMKRSLARGAKKLTFLYEDSDEPLDAVSWQGCEIMALTFGVLTIVLLGWFILMPMSKRSILLQVLGISWENDIKYHRWLGWYTLTILILHMVLYIVIWVYASGNPLYDPEGNLLRHMLLPRSCNDGSCDEDTNRLHIEVMYGYAATFVMIVICITSLKYVRRKFFEVFFYTHQLYRLVILFTCFHYAKSLLYIIPGISMILIDKSISWLAHFFTVKAEGRIITPDLLELKINKSKHSRYEAGQYVFVNCPLVNALEWHPITVTWATEKMLVVHIKTRGKGSWTQRVFDEIQSTNDSRGYGYINVRVDGFYGRNQIDINGLKKKDAVLFFAGGCGLTCPFSIISEFCEEYANVPVYLHWITRTKEEFGAFERLLLEIKERYLNLTISVWITLHHDTVDTEAPPTFNPAATPGSTTKGNGEGWRGLPCWLWPISVHALINAIGVVLATAGYALARHNSAGDNLSSQARYLLVNRFMELLSSCAVVAVFIYVLIGLRLCFSKYQRQQGIDSTSSTATVSTGSSDTTGIDNISSHCEVEDLPIVVGVGGRPDISRVFNEIKQAHPANVAVIACGPISMCQSIKNECQKRILDNWTFLEEEWEW